MASQQQSPLQRAFSLLASIKTGVVLLILLAIVSAAGTIILQRPLTEPDVMAKTYSPTTLAYLDKLGLTDVYHTWYFVLLLTLVSISIICVTLERWPNAWRYYSKPYRRPEAPFRAGNRLKAEFPIVDSASGIAAAERAFRRIGLKPQRVVEDNTTSLFAEKSKFAVMAVFIVHISLLLIFAGGIIDSVWGYKSYVQFVPGETVNTLELRGGGTRQMSFSLRCDGTGVEHYPNSQAPKRWWTKLTVLEDGKEMMAKEIAVNDPLTYKGIRFFQSGFGASDSIETVTFHVHPQTVKQTPNGPEIEPGEHREGDKNVELALKKPVQLDADTTVEMAQFIPDFYIQGNDVFRKSNNLVNPAIELKVVSKGQTYTAWLFPNVQQAHNTSPYSFQPVDAKQANFTGLQVAYEPGQWGVWGGCILMGVGLVVAFYLVHLRFWAVPVADGKGGLVLWVGAAANKNREVVEQRFRELTDALAQELGTEVKDAVGATAAAGK